MKWLHNLLKGISLTGALFVFQACYGIPEGPLYEFGEAPMDFSLVSKETGEALSGISISVDLYGNRELGVTGEDGSCHVEIPYLRNEVGPVIYFRDPDGKFAAKDTTLDDLQERVVLVKMNPSVQ